MAPLILDASVLIGLLDTGDAHHTLAVDEVETADYAGAPLLTPASAYSEALVSFARGGRLSDARAAIAERAAELRAGHDRLRLPDAIVLATAGDVGADLLTYDDRLRRVAAEASE